VSCLCAETAMCIKHQLHPRPDALFYVTDVVLPPIIFVVGVAGNLLIFVILSRRSMRRLSAVYVYYTAVAVVDLLALLCAALSFVRDLDHVPLSVAYSRSMAYAIWTRHAVEPILRHTAGWLTATAAGVRCATVRLGTVAESSAHWTGISANRVIAFVIFVSCILLDFTRFLDAAVVELTDHCFAGIRLWSHNVTALGRRRFYVELQPAVSSLAGEALPIALSLLFALILIVGHLRCCRRTASVALHTPVDDDERQHQLSVTVFALSTAFIILDGPTAAVGLARVFYFRSSTATGSENSHALYNLSLIARCLSLARCAVNCVIIAVVNYDFRKTARRTCCCCCTSQDDVYFEPVACCRRPRRHKDHDRPKRLSWNQPDYMETTESVVARDSRTRNDDELHQMTLLRAVQQRDYDSSLWI